MVEDIEGLREEKIINIEGIEGVDNNVALVFNDIEMAPEWVSFYPRGASFRADW